jgi:hypothetical protein
MRQVQEKSRRGVEDARVEVGSEAMSTPNFADILSRKHDDAKEMTEYLATADPRDYRKHARWFPLMVACHNAGVDRKVFIDWCTRDPQYSGHAKRIGYRWDSLGKWASARREAAKQENCNGN